MGFSLAKLIWETTQLHLIFKNGIRHKGYFVCQRAGIQSTYAVYKLHKMLFGIADFLLSFRCSMLFAGNGFGKWRYIRVTLLPVLTTLQKPSQDGVKRCP